jgi:hypothetical protein
MYLVPVVTRVRVLLRLGLARVTPETEHPGWSSKAGYGTDRHVTSALAAATPVVNSSVISLTRCRGTVNIGMLRYRFLLVINRMLHRAASGPALSYVLLGITARCPYVVRSRRLVGRRGLAARACMGPAAGPSSTDRSG